MIDEEVVVVEEEVDDDDDEEEEEERRVVASLRTGEVMDLMMSILYNISYCSLKGE